MDYHQDRFDDFSLMVYNNKKLVALLPANRVGDTLYSHQGLTYGGLLLGIKETLPEIESIMESLIKFLKIKGITKLVIKIFPDIYSSDPCNELTYILNKKTCKLLDQNLLLAINYRSDYKIHKSKLKRFRKYEKGKFQIKSGIEELQTFWVQLLEPRLLEKHSTRPVHNLDEIIKLKEAFPNQIEQYGIYHDDELLAGITIFKTKMTVKSQYGIASKLGEKIGALDMLFVKLIRFYQNEGFQYFSMGRINDNSMAGGYNEGMLKQKQELGCQLYVQPVYELDING